MPLHRLISVVVFSLIAAAAFASDDAATKTDARYPFRTDFANSSLPWYQPKPHEFPPHHSDRRISGELVSADFIHRTGQFRASKSGELVDFTMPPYGNLMYLNAEADLRDVPLGTDCLFFLNQDSHGRFTRLATLRDQFSIDAGHGFTYRLDDLKLSEGKLLITKQNIAKKEMDAGKRELLVNDQTRVWKGGTQIKLTDLAVGDDLLFNLTGKTATDPGRCTDIWVGIETQKRATQAQHDKFVAFEKFRGLPAWIDRVDGNKLTVTLFSGDPNTFKETWMSAFAVGGDIRVCVANEELRTWNPGSDGEAAAILEVQNTPVDAYGTSGVRLVVNVKYLLEGFRGGRVVRLFGTGWTRKDPPYGEGLMNYGYGGLRDAELEELGPKEYPGQFPFRTDYGNENFPWYQLKSGEVPPRFSDHLVLGELVKVDPAARSGQFRTDRTGEPVDFALIPEGAMLRVNDNKPNDGGPARFKGVPASVRYLNADADLADLPLQARYRFHLYQDEKGAFTRASLVTDEFSYLTLNAVTYRIDAIHLGAGKLYVARTIPEIKNYNGDMVQPPDIGRTELLVNAETRVWKEGQPVKLSDLAVGDSLLVNLASEQPGCPSVCTEIWDGPQAQWMATEQQNKRHKAGKR